MEDHLAALHFDCDMPGSLITKVTGSVLVIIEISSGREASTTYSSKGAARTVGFRDPLTDEGQPRGRKHNYDSRGTTFRKRDDTPYQV